MSKRTRNVLIGILIVLLGMSFFANKQKIVTPTNLTQTGSTYGEYIVGSSGEEQGQVYGNVVATNGATITTSVGGIVQSMNCQIGAEVKKGQIIAQFVPAADLQTENLGIQKDFLGQQVGVLQDALAAGLQNVDIQIATLKDQKKTNEQQLALLQQNLDNAKRDNNLQLSSLKTQLANLKEQEKADNSKTSTSLKNQIQAAQTTALGAITMVDTTFNITNTDLINEAYIYVGAKDTPSKDLVVSQFNNIKYIIDNLTSVSGDVVGQNLQTLATYFSLAAKVVNNSVPDIRYFPQSKIDALFATFNGTASSMIAAKTNFDVTYAATVTVRATYNTQITALENQIASLGSTKTDVGNVSNNSQINSLQSQVNSLQLTISSFDNQLASLKNSKDIQTQSTNGQLLNVEQNYQLIANNLGGEALYSPIDGVVKSSSVVVGNKVGANVAVCAIGPKTVEGLKIQIFSAKDLSVGQEVYIYDGMEMLGTGTIDHETLSVDPQTQNKGYEITTLVGTQYREGEKVTLRFDNTPASDETWIPIHYITPKLDGYYVTQKFVDGNKDVMVEVGDINNARIRILSGLNYGDILVK